MFRAGNTRTLYSFPTSPLPPGGSIQMEVRFTPVATANSCTVSQIDQHFIASSDIGSPYGIIDIDTTNNAVQTLLYDTHNCSDLYVKKSVSNVNVSTLAPLSFDLLFGNAGPWTATGVYVEDILPSGFVYQSGSCVSSGSGACGSIDYDATTQKFSSVIPVMPIGEIFTYRIYGISVNYSSSWTNTATISHRTPNEIEVDSRTNTSTVNFTVTGNDPVVTKTTTTPWIRSWSPIRYRISVTNPKNGDILTGGTIHDLLPMGLTYLTTDAFTLSGGSTRERVQDPLVGENDLTWWEFTLLPGGSLTIDFQVATTDPSVVCGPSVVYNNSVTYSYISQLTGSDTRMYDGTLVGQTGEDVHLRCPLVITAYPDAYTIRNDQSLIAPILSNDLYDGRLMGSFEVPPPIITQLVDTGGLMGVSIAKGGKLSVSPWATPWVYVLTYKICDPTDTTNCSTTTVHITVTALPPIVASPDTVTLPFGQTGTVALLPNDTLSGVTALPTTVWVQLDLSSLPDAYYDPASDTMTIPATTPPGTYTVPYTICDVTEPTHCSTTNVQILIAITPINAALDMLTLPEGSGWSLALLSNDTLSGILANTGTVVVDIQPSAIITGSTYDPLMDRFIVPPPTPAWTYTIPYKICELVNPTNCSFSTVIIHITPVIITNTNTGTTSTGTTTMPSNPSSAGGGIAIIPITTPITVTAPLENPILHSSMIPFLRIIGSPCDGEVKNLTDPLLVSYYGILSIPDQSKSERRVSRWEFIKLLVQASNVPNLSIINAKNPYSDLSLESEYAPYILTATAYGLVSGNNGKFFEHDLITRAEASKVLVLAANINLSKNIYAFDDIGSMGMLQPFIQTAYDNCILHGRHTLDGISLLPDGRRVFEPEDGITIAETIKVVYNLTHE